MRELLVVDSSEIVRELYKEFLVPTGKYTKSEFSHEEEEPFLTENLLNISTISSTTCFSFVSRPSSSNLLK